MIYKLIAENLSSVSRMGAPTTNWTRYFNKMENAKYAAEIDFGRSIKWKMRSNDTVATSGDLQFVVYDISPVDVE